MNVQVILQFALATLLPVVFCLVLTRVEHNSIISQSGLKWQIIVGVIFGVIAIFGTEAGIAVGDYTMNVRDAAPLTAGLFFGGPAGIIAGVIGGVERWFAALWGRGMFTRVACSIATVAAGFYAAFLRRVLFDDRKPSWPMAMASGVVVEVLHLLLVFLTNPLEPTRAFAVVAHCSAPMIICNGISVALSSFCLTHIAHQARPHQEDLKVTQIVQGGMLLAVVLAFAATTAFSSVLQSSIAKSEANSLLSVCIEDTTEQVREASDSNLLAIVRRASSAIPSVGDATDEAITNLVNTLDVTEICVVNNDGIIVASNVPQYINFDMDSDTQSREFLCLTTEGGELTYVQPYQPTSYDSNVMRKYAGAHIFGGFIQVAYDGTHFMNDIKDQVKLALGHRHVGQTGFMLAVNEVGDVLSANSEIKDAESYHSAVAAAERAEEGSVFETTVAGTSYLAMYQSVEGYRVIALLPKAEANYSRDVSALITAFMEVLVFAALFAVIFYLIKHTVVESIWSVNGRLSLITNGDLNTEVDVRTNAEFASLSDGINVTVGALKGAIAAEAARFERDLATAKAIQESALPTTFPPFPEINAFDIYASMNPAREVGGDFYDFFLIDGHTLGFLIADVSGKGIPASLFMMAAKTELSNYMSSGMPLAEAVKSANYHLCQGNEAGMFVTVWAASLNYETGELTYVNAGHNPPLLRHDGTWEWLKKRSGLFLGTFDSANYRSQTLIMEPGDELILYTDGVNEAFNAEEEQYGDERLEAFLSTHAALHPRALVSALRGDLAVWAKDTEQSDDITMLCLEYGAAPEVHASMTVPATLENLEVVFEFIHDELRKRTCPVTVQNSLDIALEEMFVNVCNYAYADQDEPGTCTISYTFNASSNTIAVQMEDKGVPFDPLEHVDPTRPRSIEETAIGGLGILMTKRNVDDISYLRDGDKNVIAFTKSW